MTSLNGSIFENSNIVSSDEKEKYNLKKYILNGHLIENETTILNKNKQPTGYLDHKDDLIIIVTGKGSIFFIDKSEIKNDKYNNSNLNFKSIPNNIENYFKYDEDFYTHYHIAIRDSLIDDGYIILVIQ